MSNKIGLSKSKYCKGIQCPKILWLDMYKSDKANNVASESAFKTGNMVDDVARDYFGECVVVEYNDDKQKMIFQTVEYMRNGCENIAEASFIYDGLYCAVDILRKNGDGYDIYEVKSSTTIKDIYIDDMAFQYYVLTKSGVNIKNVFNMHINSKYVRNGELDLKQLFIIEDYTETVKGKSAEVEKNISDIRKYIDTDTEPVRTVDVYCENPYECPYKSYCIGDIPTPSVFDILRLTKKKKYQYYNNGIITFEDIIKNKIKLSPTQKIQVEEYIYKKADVIDKKAIGEFLNTLTYPIYHLDFETYQQVIPQFDGISPYVQIPFQYSLHIEYADGRLEHREFLAKEGTDPRRLLAEQLVHDIPSDACVTAYNMSFECDVIEKLAYLYGDLADKLMKIHDNIHDIMIPFQKKYYYNSAMQGKYSIKYVLPALFPDEPALNYHNLKGVHNGGEASATFADMINHSDEEIAQMRENLLRYCELDTYAMVKVLEKLREAII